ncbi:chromosomal replication initiator protein DnaA [Caulobacter sp. 17J80-11]|uniref:chromosomal replication initiator protein DnaA n=1 Tax=Caulobacter sp. 17J80-11 TaxID=2763502 RepID=UPI001653CF9D|nr:chromosomal replication initiator protein DnaA [Caulobacter sp. 17J80-11]MBC6981481.1 chromosomal replication initiator protein DnaA [Caulobacter sp. 17J80-11]
MAVRLEAVTPAETVWTKVAAALRGELGEGAFNSYVAPSAVREGYAGAVCLVTPTAYARDWVRRNALRRVAELWRQHDPDGRQLDVKSRVEFEAESAPAAAAAAPVEAPKPAQSATVIPITDGPRAVRAAGLQERLTFDTFVPGRGNDFAHAMARQVATWVDGHFNPVFFHGPYGYGKTHLLNAIAWEAQRLRPDAKVIYLTAERFLSTFVKAVMDRATAAFKEELRGADLLLIDDVHFIGGKPSSQEELFHTLTALVEDGRRVVLSGDRPPSAMVEVEPRLRSHLGAGLVCAIEPADKPLRLGVVERKFEALAGRQIVDLPARPDVVEFLADRVPGSIRELEGAINTLAAGAGSRLSRLTVEEAQGLLQPNLRGGVERRITVDEIQKTTAEHFGLKQADLLSERRTRAVARPRQVAMYLCKQHTTRSYPDIGRRFGGRDHTTVLHAVKKIEELMGKDEQIARDVETLSRKLRG